MQENSLFLGYVLKYLKVKGHNVKLLFSNISFSKNCINNINYLEKQIKFLKIINNNWIQVKGIWVFIVLFLQKKILIRTYKYMLYALPQNRSNGFGSPPPWTSRFRYGFTYLYVRSMCSGQNYHFNTQLNLTDDLQKLDSLFLTLSLYTARNKVWLVFWLNPKSRLMRQIVRSLNWN